MKASKILFAAALAAVSGVALAAPQDLGSGPATYTFGDTHDRDFFVTLGPGTYDISSEVTSTGFDLTTVWLSYNKDHNPHSPNGNDIATFDQVTPTDWKIAYAPLVLTTTTQLYIDVNTHLGKAGTGQFNGSVTIDTIPIPEPANATLLLAGLGLMGLVARRRRG